MSFDLMISLTGVERIVVRDGGIVLVGLRTVLIPMSIISENPRVVQWYLLDSEENDGAFIWLHTQQSGFLVE